jgi:gamma-polyglutamate biosynthesis protein CapC
MLNWLSTHIFPLNIFPVGGLDSSVITTVWVGIFVVCMFNLRFGWVMSGLIVPGYLVPLLLIKPSAAAVVLVESVLTYFLVWWYSEVLSMRMGWSRFFGRDRFFAMVLVSVAIRIISDGYALPWIGDYVNQQWHWDFDYQNNLHSFGLIITALVANNFWKTGLRRGLFTNFVAIAITYCLVRFVLMEYTNFSMSSIGFLYEDVATSFLASPKTYMILIITAFLASRMSLYYGWDFSGILIPALLALQWHQPQKILMSFIEALVIYWLASLVLQAPLFKRITMEGARKLLLFFNVSFVYKILLAYAILQWWPDLKISDYYGFGYLLPTLIAVKMHDKQIMARMSAAVLQTSVVACAFATVLGFSLSLLPTPVRFLPNQTVRQDIHHGNISGQPIDWLLSEKQAAYHSLTQKRFIKPGPGQSQAFEAALHLLQQQESATSPITNARLDQIAQLLHQANYRLRKNGDLLLLTENEPRKFWGSYLINLAAKQPLLIEVPAPLEEPGALEAATSLFGQTGARMLAVAGASRRASEDGSADVLAFPNSLYHSFHRRFARRSTLQVRTSQNENAGSVLHVKGELPARLSLTQLQQSMGKIEVSWQAAPGNNVQRDSVANGFAELVLAAPEARKIIATLTPNNNNNPPGKPGDELVGEPVGEQNINRWLAFDKTQLAASGSNLYRPPSAGELIFIDKDILTPLIRLLDQGKATQAGHLQLINLRAQALGYEVRLFHSLPEKEDFIILAESGNGNPKSRRYWGSVVFRVNPAKQAYLVQVPRPYFDPNSLELGISMFGQLRASVFMMANASPLANQDRSADLLTLQNKANLLNLVTQVWLREHGQQNTLTLQTRALSARPDTYLPESDLLVSFSNGVEQAKQASPMGQTLLQALERHGLRYQFADGQRRSSEYSAAAAQQTMYQATAQNREIALLWASPLATTVLRQQTVPNAQNMQFKALNIPMQTLSVSQRLAKASPASSALPAALQQQLNQYLQTQDVVVLHQLVQYLRQHHPDLKLEYVADSVSQRAYLLVWQGEQWVAALNLSSKDPGRIQAFQTQAAPATQAQQFIHNNMTWWLARNAS